MPATKRAFSSQPVPISFTPRFLLGPEAEELEKTIYAKIRDRAYQLFEESGQMAGNEDANWLQAESEVLRAGALHVRESGSWVALNASLPDAGGEDLQIAVKPKRVLVSAYSLPREAASASPAAAAKSAIFLAANLSAEIEPSSAAGSFRDDHLRVMIRKLHPDELIGRS
jgi:hypothetical protein